MAGGPDEDSTPEPGHPGDEPQGPDHAADDDAAAQAPDDVERRWAEIISTLDDLADDTPAAPTTSSAGPPADESAPRPDPIDADPRGWVADDDEPFEPPDPGPVLGGDPLLTLAWIGVVGPPALLMVVTILWQDVPTLVLQVAGVVFLAGLGVLIWRMPDRRDHDDGPGAVV